GDCGETLERSEGVPRVAELAEERQSLLRVCACSIQTSIAHLEESKSSVETGTDDWGELDAVLDGVLESLPTLLHGSVPHPEGPEAGCDFGFLFDQSCLAGKIESSADVVLLASHVH